MKTGLVAMVVWVGLLGAACGEAATATPVPSPTATVAPTSTIQATPVALSPRAQVASATPTLVSGASSTATLPPPPPRRRRQWPRQPLRGRRLAPLRSPRRHDLRRLLPFLAQHRSLPPIRPPPQLMRRLASLGPPTSRSPAASPSPPTTLPLESAIRWCGPSPA